MGFIVLRNGNVAVLSVLVIIICIAAPVAFAHPFAVSTDPAGLAQLDESPDKVVIFFSEPVEESFSSIKVIDSSGNRVDNDDTRFFQGDPTKLVVTLKPLKEDVYTVSSKVLSQVDGHVVEYTYAFIVGSPDVPLPSDGGIRSSRPSVYLPESLSRFPGLVGQVGIVGINFAALFLWKPIGSLGLHSAVAAVRPLMERRFKKLLIVSIVLVIGSSFAMIMVHAASLDVGIQEAIATTFGTTWITRITLSFIILGLYLIVRTRKQIRNHHYMSILAAGTALLVTTTMIGHGAATTSSAAVMLDFIHNLVASIWVGGLLYLGFIAIPSLKQMEMRTRSAVIALLVPRFSMITVVILGIIAITGPLLLWILESDLNNLLVTSYGRILSSKLMFAGAMIAIGAYNQFGIQRSALAVVSAGKTLAQSDVHSRFYKSLRIESAIGFALLFTVALLTNTSLPGGELPLQTFATTQNMSDSSADGIVPTVFMETQFVDDSIVNLRITPARVGINDLKVSIVDRYGNPIGGINDVKVKLTQSREGIGPLASGLVTIDDSTFAGNVTFTTNGRWSVEVLAGRQAGLNIVTTFDVMIKPSLNELRFDVTEYSMPANDSLPLFPVYDNGTLWISDTGAPRIWNFNIETKEFRKFDLEGNLTTILDLDSDGKIWFLDPVSRSFGYVSPNDGSFKTYSTPSLGLPVSIDIDFRGDVWLALLDTNAIAKFSGSTETFEIFTPSTNDSQPSAVIVDDFGTVWFAEAAAGKIGRIDPVSKEIEEFVPATGPMAEPFALLMDDEGNIWIAEHLGPRVTLFDPILQTFASYQALDPKALPFGMTLDSFGNLWFAQHVVDNVGILNPHSGNMIEVSVPTNTSFVQWLTGDDKGTIWFAEQRGMRIGSITIAQKPPSRPIEHIPSVQQPLDIRYAEVIAPGMSVAIVLSSLFYVKSVYDFRKTLKLVRKLVL